MGDWVIVINADKVKINAKREVKEYKGTPLYPTGQTITSYKRNESKASGKNY